MLPAGVCQDGELNGGGQDVGDGDEGVDEEGQVVAEKVDNLPGGAVFAGVFTGIRGTIPLMIASGWQF